MEAPMKIELNARDFQIREVTLRTGQNAGQIVRVVELKPAVAFDPDFIAEMELRHGVKEWKPYARPVEQEPE